VAKEIEIVSTVKDGFFSFDDIIAACLDNTFDRSYIRDQVLSIADVRQDNKAMPRTSLIKAPSLYYDVYNHGGEKLFSLWGPTHDVESEIYTAEEKINDAAKFDASLLPRLIADAVEANTSYTIRWSSTSNDEELLVYIVCLAISKIVSGVIVNQFGSKLMSGTYLYENWRALLLTELEKNR